MLVTFHSIILIAKQPNAIMCVCVCECVSVCEQWLLWEHSLPTDVLRATELWQTTLHHTGDHHSRLTHCTTIYIYSTAVINSNSCAQCVRVFVCSQCSTAVEEPKIHPIPQIQGDNRLKIPSSSVLNHQSYITTSTFRPTNPTKIVIRCPSPFSPFVLQSSGCCGDGTVHCTLWRIVPVVTQK